MGAMGECPGVRYAAMLTKKCDNCDRLIQAPDDAAGKKVKCPHCGDINLFPGGEPARAADPVEKVGTKPAKGGEPERSVLKVRPTMFRARPVTFLGLGTGLLASAAGGVYLLTSTKSEALGWACLGLAGVLVGVFGVWRIKNLGNSLEVTNKRTIERVGLFSRFTSEIMHDDVRNVQITQSFIQRVMGVGQIGISSAAQDGLEISVKDVRNPDRIRETIDRYRSM